MKVSIQRTAVLYMLASSVFLAACGSSNSTSPNPTSGNIPNLSSKPSAKASVLKTQRLTGVIIDANTRRPIDQADIVLHLLSAPSPSASPGSNNSSSNNSPRSTPVPAQPTASSTPFPSLTPTPTPAGGASPSPNTSPTPVDPAASALGAPEESPETSPEDTPEGGLTIQGDENGNLEGTTEPEEPEVSASPADPALPSEEVDPEAQNAAIEVTETYVMAQLPSNNNREAKFNIFETRSNNRGKFFINDVPEGDYVISVAAKGYRSLTLTEVNPNRLELPLIPLDNKRMMDVSGSVLSPTNTPVPNAFVSSSFPMGEAIGIPSTTNTIGEFNLLAVPFGRRSFVAFVQNADEEILQMGILKNIIVNDKSIKADDPLYEDGPASVPASVAPEDADTETLIKNIQENLKEPVPEASGSPAEEESVVSPYKSEEETPEDTPSEEAPDPAESPLISPPIEPYPAPSVTPSVAEENQEAEEEGGVNVFSAVREFFTGEKAEESEDVKIAPIVSLRSVVDQITLAGTIDVPADYTLKSMDVYMTLDAEKGTHPEEVYLLTKTFRAPEPEKKSLISTGNQTEPTPSPGASAAASGNTPAGGANANAKSAPAGARKFQVKLPVLNQDQYYHLQFTATHKDGGITYHHLYNLDKEDDALKATFLPVSGRLEIEGEDSNTIPAVPGMGWESVPGADIYHVTLEAGNRAKRRVVWEAWTKSTQIEYPFTARKDRLKEQETYTLSVAALKGVKPVLNKTKNVSAHPAYESIWADLSRVTHVPFEVVEY